MAKNSQDFPSNKRQFNWTTKVSNEDGDELITLKSLNLCSEKGKEEENPTGDVPIFKSNLSTIQEEKKERDNNNKQVQESSSNSGHVTKRKLQVAVSRLRFALTAALNKNRGNLPNGLGHRVVGTLFGHRKGHVHFAFQRDASSRPVMIVELATPISGLVKEMASGLVRIALECDKTRDEEEKNKGKLLLEQPLWRTYCNGKKCGFATLRECGEKELRILKAVEPISMGAGVLPPGEEGEKGDENDGEIMYMRAKFERVVGSRDSEAFYMMNPDCNGTPELSIYLLRV